MLEDLLKSLATYTLDRDASPASEDDVRPFEHDIGGHLPDEYRDFLMTSGPIGIENPARLALDDGGSAAVSALYGLGCDPEWDVRHQTFDVYAGRIPDETIPIGEDGDTGDQVLLVFDGPRRGEIAIWLHDHPEIDGQKLD